MKIVAFVPIVLLALLLLPDNPSGPLNRVPNVNNGGCGWVAYYLSGQLPGSAVEDFGDHYMVRYKGRLLDSRGTWGPLLLIRGKPVSREALRARLLRPELWNPAFNLNDTTRIKRIVYEYRSTT